MLDTAAELSGWAGMILILMSYILITLNKITANDKSYQLLNFVGSSFFIFHLHYNKAWPAMWLNIIWAIIGAFALIRIFIKKP
jgi:hypothetical protein